jgi:hypothetical protein
MVCSVCFLTSGSFAGFTFMILPIPELAIPSGPWQLSHFALYVASPEVWAKLMAPASKMAEANIT